MKFPQLFLFLLFVSTLAQAQIFWKPKNAQPEQPQSQKFILFFEEDQNASALFKTALYVNVPIGEGVWEIGFDYQFENDTNSELFFDSAERLQDVQVRYSYQEEGSQEWKRVPLTAEGKLVLNKARDAKTPPVEIPPSQRYVGTTGDLLEIFAVPMADTYHVQLSFSYYATQDQPQTLTTDYFFSVVDLQDGIQRALDQK